MPHLPAQFKVERHPPQAEFARHAARYARTGWHVFPIRPGTRRAYLSIKHHGARWGSSATPDVVAEMWRRWPRADIGIDAALSGFFFLDVDTIEGHGHDGGASLNALEITHGALPPTRTAVTPTNGRQFLFRRPGRPVRNSTSRLGPGLDVIGDGGMFIAPPSTGRAWASQVDIAPAPRWLLNLVGEQSTARARNGPRSARVPQEPRGTATPELIAMMRTDAGRGVSRATEDVCLPDDPELKIWCALRVIPADTDYHTWFRIGGAIHSALGEAGFELFDDWSRESEHKYPINGCADKWRECAKTTAIGVDTLYWLADNADRGWRAAYRVLLSKENAR
jgi:hypothetical protein